MTKRLRKFKPPEKVAHTVYVYLWYPTCFDKPSVMVTASKMSDPQDWIFVCAKTIDIDLSDIGEVDMISGLVEQLEKHKQTILARHHVELKQVQDKIDNLLAIEYQPSEAA